MNNAHKNQFDVIILGSGVGGATLATILAKHNLNVLMVDKKSHPRYAIGESLTTHTELLLKLLSRNYSIPEFEHLSSFQNIKEHLSTSACGHKRIFGFLYHNEGEEQSSHERIQWGTGDSSHLFRQEVDHYLVKASVSYGAKLLENINVVDLEISQHSVRIIAKNGESFTADYLVDASGYNSILARKFNLREYPTRFKTHSRSLFTHMINVKGTDEAIRESNGKKSDIPWKRGTTHHIFKEGWMWVIPFDNHEQSTNPVCSVGVNFNSRYLPKNGLAPEQEFQQFIMRFPSIASQFESAQTVQRWTSTDRIQYSSRICVGERFYILPHSSGFVDPIFSVGLSQTFLTINPLAALILQAVSEKDFSSQNFLSLASLQEKIFNYNDMIAHCTYISFRDFNLMNAWLRVWLMQHLMPVWKLGFSQIDLFTKGYKPRSLSQLTDIKYLEDLDTQISPWGNGYVSKAIAEMEKVEKGLISPNEAALNIISTLNSASWLFRAMGIGDTSQNYFDLLKSQRFNLSLLAFAFWSQIFLAKSNRPFDFTISDFFKFRLNYA
ncbi:NAD(P)/FAD-dependent oxidoreductase [Adonisia turfae]|uniref:FAD-dependent oxidoreductase n=1 Tax=Adonisia turfae CCMR0081 TaxID=2292702 RepID=A0A6M0RJB6_9CYAN|nr:tryptophan 7-halogenase [Adonisia turfae]NEZ55872.1 FAD-dependent oxidoreductase [Adonisia turfae CCMR0081]